MSSLIYPNDSELCAVIDGDVYELLSGDVSWQGDEIVRCGVEPWYFASNYVRTIRRDESGSYVEPIPSKAVYRYMFDLYVRYSRLAVGKSRQLMATWTAMAYCVWFSMWNENIQIFCQQKKEEDADLEMVQRCWTIWRNLPLWMRSWCPAKYSYGLLSFPKNGCIIKAIPCGGDQIRSHNPNVLVSDEIAFQDRAEESYTNALACCQRIILISTPGAGFFCDFVHDRLN